MPTGDAATLLVGEGIETLSLVAAVPALPAAALSAGSLAAFAPPPGVVRLLIAADRDATGQRAAATLEARALAQGLAATVLTSEHGDFNDDLAALGPQALAARLGHGMMQGTPMEPPGPAGAVHEAATCESLRRERA